MGGTKENWIAKPMDSMFPMASRIFLQTHVWPMLLRESRVDEIRLEILEQGTKRVPVLVNSHQTSFDSVDCFIWVFFVTTERSRYEQELLAAKQRAETLSADLTKRKRFIRTVADAMPSMITYWDIHLVCQFANQPFLEWFGRSAEETLGASLTSISDPSLLVSNMPHIRGVLAGAPQEFERSLSRLDGSVAHTLVHYKPDIDVHGAIQGFFAFMADVTRQREADAAIRLSASVFEATMEAIMVIDATSTIISVNPAFTAQTGYTPAEVVGKNARILKSGRHNPTFFSAIEQELQRTKLWRGDVWCQRRDGSVYLGRISISAISNQGGAAVRYVCVGSDITEQWDKEQQVHHMALHDTLTDLPNRALLRERMVQLMAMSAREPRLMGLMFLDLDGFKQVNDSGGHEFGDHVLKTIATRLLGLIRPSDTVARLGGDEFVILLDKLDCRDNAAEIAARVIEEVNAPLSFNGITARVGTSIGIAFYTPEHTSPEDFLKSADEAMYQAKGAGKNTYRFAN